MEYLSSLFYSFGLSGFIASRAFLPAFITALAMKHGDKIPMIGNLDFVKNAAENPNWFTHPVVLWGLGILAVVEFLADKSPEARELLDEGMVYAKTAISAATTMGLLGPEDAAAASDLISQAGVFDVLPAAFFAGVTYVFASTRCGVMGILNEADQDDALGIRGFVSWCEELWAFLGVWLLLIIPSIMAILIGCVYGVFWLIQKRHEKKIQDAKIECLNCQTRIHPFATACYACQTPQASPRTLGLLGGMKAETTHDIENHRFRLIELKRSPLSGDHIEGRGVDVEGEIDKVKPLGDPDLTRKYMGNIDSRLSKVLILGALFSLLPGIGLIVGVIYYRFQLVAPYRRYLPWTKGLGVKWLLRLLFFVLSILQFVPLAGGLAVPIMAFLNHRLYRASFTSELKRAGLAV